MNSQINLALIGASGVVGEKIMTLLENRATKINNFYPLGDSSVGTVSYTHLRAHET